MDHEYIAIVPEVFERDMPMTIGVDKIGGGTLGLRYDGDWIVSWYDNGERRRSDPLRTGSHKTHDEVAAIAADFWADALGFTEDNWATCDRLSYFATNTLNFR